MRIVVLVTGGIEEQILLFPTLETLKQQYPSGAIDVIAPPSAKGQSAIASTMQQFSQNRAGISNCSSG
jgi:ADP-heptose:LPS heptosyltransferase